MNVELFVLGILSVLLVGSNVFWAKLHLTMADRLMSRNFFEFTQTEKLKTQVNVRRESKEDDFLIDPIDERQAQSLNATFGLGA